MSRSDVDSPVEGFLARLNSAEARFEALVRRQTAGLSSADSTTGERWDAGQVWAHVAEFISYWIAQVERVLAAGGSEPVSFGRTKTDPDRVEAIERDRHTGPDALWQAIQSHIDDLRKLLREMPAHGWGLLGRHQTRGVMPVSRIIDEFLIGHLEEHAVQLEQLGRHEGTE